MQHPNTGSLLAVGGLKFSTMDKKLINAAADCVAEAIQGVLLSDSRLMRVDGLNILVRADVDTSKQSTVSIISGEATDRPDISLF
jgi:hypothetical protein